MPRFSVYPHILPEVDEQTALEYAATFDWGADVAQLQDIKYAEHIDTVNGVGVYYDFGADYYFFTDDEEDIN